MKLHNILQYETVADVGYYQPIKVQENLKLRKAVKRMAKGKTGCLLVLKGKRLTGIFTERDFLIRTLDREEIFNLPISNFMTPDPVVAHINEPIYQVLARMYAGGMRHLPVLGKRGQPIGTISVGQVAYYLAELHPTIVYNLPPDPANYPSAREGG